ncbi:MAG TPA: amino acid adenylation domain-containing protein, partial [Bacillota bacterium]|nr:amino acid adenylation domain-containing protein [Bacillota bacterium]
MDFNTVKKAAGIRKDNSQIKEISNREIAIIGMSAQFPEAANVDQFWRNIKDGLDCIGKFPAARQKDTDQFLEYQGKESFSYYPGAYFNEIDQFDYAFFRLSPKEASLMSPNQRLFLETAWHTIEDAGYGGKKLIGSQTGVYLGFEADAPYDYKRFISLLDPDSSSIAVTGNLTPIIASRLSYLLDLHGPSLSVDTACSSSLVAIHLACQALRNGECDLALAGSVRINLLPVAGQLQFGIESSDGRAHSFDDKADGTGSGEGVAAVLLKPLGRAIKDGDQIYAVIKGSAVNQDGSSIGITAPNVLAQESVIVNAWKDAGIDPETISYIEAHGTGTRLGDPIEIDGIRRAFGKYTAKKQFCAIGTVKTNLGHLDNAAGIAGLIKAVQALRAKKIPPMLHFNQPNRQISFDNSPVYVNDRLADWESNGHPRRCGISSFGFSGTNCHLVLEEAPAGPSRAAAPGAQVLTISAKSQSALRAALANYADLVRREDLPDLADICYTANTGRGHYNCRLALIVKDRADLVEKIRRLSALNLKAIDGPAIFYGEHRIVSSTVEDKSEDELTETELKQFTLKAREVFYEYITDGQKRTDLLIEICRAYAKGADINWEELYLSSPRSRVSLPVYPFERKRCWVEQSQAHDGVKKRNESFKRIGPFIDRLGMESLDLEIYTVEFDPVKHWALNEHQIKDYMVLVGTAYLEMVIEACRRHFNNNSAVEFSDLMFISPLQLRWGETREVQLILRTENHGFDFSVVSQSEQDDDGSKGWTKHLEGKIRPLSERAQAPAKAMAPGDIKIKQAQEFAIPDFELYIKESAFTFGPHWKNIRKMEVGEQELLSYLELPENFTGELADYILHPALLDNALTTIPLLPKVSGDNPSKGVNPEIFLPFSYQSIRVYQRLPAKFYSWVRYAQPVSPEAEFVTFDISLFDLHGTVITEIEGYTLKRINPNRFSPRLELEAGQNLFYQLGWVIQDPADGPAVLPPGNVLMIKNNQGFSNELAANLRLDHRLVFEAEWGPVSQKCNGHKYLINGTGADYEALLADLAPWDIRLIIHTQTVSSGGPPQNITELAESQNRGVKSLFNLTKALLKNKTAPGIRIIVISELVNEVTGQEERIIPENATLFGLAKVIGQEYANLECKCIDIDDKTKVMDVIAEFSETQSPHVAYRNGQRYLAEFQTAGLAEFPEEAVTLKSEGVYLITGGAGGIGLEIAKYLAAKNKVNLALLNRSPLPERKDWVEILGAESDPKLCRKIRAIQEIEASGSSVKYYSVDVSSFALMEEAIKDLRHAFGKINGIIHSAGIAGAGFIANQDETVFERVLAPKVAGTWIIDELTRNDHLDFFIMCSSVTTLMGVSGQGDYTAANAYQDSFAASRAKRGARTLVINWAGWRETGMAYEYGINPDGVFKAISTETAIKALDRIFSHFDLNRAIVGILNYQHEMFAAARPLPIKLSKEIAQGLRKRGPIKPAFDNSAPVKTAGRKTGNYSETENQIAQVFGLVLGVSEINIFDNFYDLGGDSIIGMKIVNSLNDQMKIRIDVSAIFQYPSIKELAEYLNQKLAKHQTETNPSYLIPKRALREFYPLSSAQRRLYILDRLEGIGAAYNMPRVIQIEGLIDRKRLEEAFRKLIQRHEILRTSFALIDGEPVQKAHQEVGFTIKYRELDRQKIEEAIQEFTIPFDLQKAPLLRVELIKIADQKYLLLLDMHHIISDGTSMDILTREIISIYEGDRPLPLTTQYIDYAIWQNENFKTDLLKRQKEYWLNVFSEPVPSLNIPTDYPRPALQSFEGDRVEFETGPELTRSVNRIAVENGATVYMVLLAAFNILLFKYTGQEDIIIGSPIAGRPDASLEKIIGLFVNTLAMRNYPAGNMVFRDFLLKVKVNCLKAYENQDYQFEELVETLDLKRDLSRNPLFDVMFVQQKPDTGSRKIEGVMFSSYEYNSKTAKFDLLLQAIEASDKIDFSLEYCTKLFKPETILRLTGHFQTILKAITAAPDLKLSEIEILTPEEKQQILVDFNHTRAGYPEGKTIHVLFEEQVAKTPDNVAVVFEDQQLTYKELNQKANQLARHLRNKGVKPGAIVGLMVLKSLEMIIGLIGILKAGGAFLPIDPEYPEERIKYMLEDSHSVLLLTQCNFIQKVYFAGEVVIYNDAEFQSLDHSNPDNLNTSSDLIYLIYTSGTTGKPKGAMLEHKNLVNLITFEFAKTNICFNTRVLQFTTISFDVCYQEIFSALLAGGELYLINNEIKRDTAQLFGFIEQNKIPVIFLPTAYVKFVLNEATHLNQFPKPVKHIITAGEQLVLSEQLIQFLKKNEIYLHNHYGPSETHVVTTLTLNPTEEIPLLPSIGKPISNTRIYILNKSRQIQPVGIAGELYIAGENVGRGYLNRTELTAEKFVPVEAFPLQETSQRIYRTGDLARWTPDGNIEFLGRIDHQVKISGYRIELGEIEHKLLQHHLIKEAVVVVKTDKSGNKYLGAYIVWNEKRNIAGLREDLAKELPNYMLPSYFIELEKLP